MIKAILQATCACALAAIASPAIGQVLYMQNFDLDDSANWTVNNGPGDEAHDFFFDYSMVGVPAAPNSGGTTRGMKLQANLVDNLRSGVSVSPNGQSFSGDHVLTFDWWHNYLGGDPDGVGVIGTTTGSTMLSEFGILTSGASPNWPGIVDSLYFAAAGDTSSSAFRAYSSERSVSYQLPHDPNVLDDLGNPIDSHATYHAGTRSNNPATGGGLEVYYQNAFPSVMVPAAQTTLFPETQHGSTVAGSTGFAWHAVEIAKVGNTVTWKVDGVLLITVDMTNFTVPPAGTNILFGHADINDGISMDPYYDDVAFTLIDNIQVSVPAPPADDADFDGDGDVDGADFLTWQENLGLTGTATLATGDANDDGNVTGADLAVWQAQFGPAAAASASAIPEPAASLLFALILGSFVARRRHQQRNGQS